MQYFIDLLTIIRQSYKERIFMIVIDVIRDAYSLLNPKAKVTAVYC